MMLSNLDNSLSKEELLLRLEEVEETLRAIRSGEVDALVVSGAQGDQVFTLKDATHPYQVLIEEMSEGALALNLQGMILYCNSRFAEILGLPMENILGESFLRFVARGDQARAKELLAHRPQGKNRGELTLQGDRSEIAVGISLKELMLEDDLRLGVVISDITQRKQAEEVLRTKNEEIKVMSQQLWQTAKLAVMGELSATITHELNNPLAIVGQHTETLLAKFPADDPDLELLRVIQSEVKRMSTLVENLLNFSHRSYPMISPTDVCEEVSKTLDIFQQQFNKRQIAVVREFPSRAPWVRADRQQLRQVFLNLFKNAIDAMPQGGTLTIRIWEDRGEDGSSGKTPASRRTTGRMGLPTLPPPYVLIEIADTGEGIPPDVLKKVWEPFFTTKAAGKGTGLGLGISQRIVLEHGGRIEIVSGDKLKKGTTVKITLPTSK